MPNWPKPTCSAAGPMKRSKDANVNRGEDRPTGFHCSLELDQERRDPFQAEPRQPRDDGVV
eukprot:10651677-Lingulodinium_polyedra.AAC.1